MNNLDKNLFLEQWDKLTLIECEEVARNLDKQLSATFRFHKVEEHICGNQRHNVAFFEWSPGYQNNGNALFALISGSTTFLGYDQAHPFIPTSEQLKSWTEETECNYDMTLTSFLDTYMTPSRHVTIQPFLLEVMATDLSQPRIFHQEWNMWVYEGKPVFHENTLKFIQDDGFRFPSSDEWEYACATGAPTLFRWGDDTPNYSIPLLGNQKITGWDLHVRQNAFGLFIARHPYHWEFCAEADVMRGGDGGTALHAGAGTFAAWLTLASAFYCPHDKRGTFGVQLRRAYSLV